MSDATFRLSNIRYSHSTVGELGSQMEKRGERGGVISANATCPKCRHAFLAHEGDATLYPIVGTNESDIRCPKCGFEATVVVPGKRIV